MLKHLIDERINEVFLEYQEANNIISGDIHPEDAVELDNFEDALAEFVERVCAKQPKAINYDDFTPSWYIYTDADGETHDVVYGYAETNQFFIDVSRRICFDDCTNEIVQKIYYKGKEVFYAGWQPCMKFEFVEANGDTVWVNHFEHWDH